MTSRQKPEEEARDILAAEAFAVPAADPALHQVKLPEDPSGIPEAHDILAAEEFAMPAPFTARGSGGVASASSRSRLGTALAAGAGLLGALLLRGRRHR
jgi:hypothetical protein